MDELALFAGAGGGLLVSRLLSWRTVAAIELDPFCRDVILARQRDGVLDPFPIWDDVRTFDGRPWRGRVDVVSGGFPCQPFSGAGKRLGADDDRNLWPETFRVLRHVLPSYAFLENVPGLLASGYFGAVLGDLAALGYRVAWDCLPASALGAHHQRDRLWILAARGGVSDPIGGQLRELGERDGEQCRQPWASESGDDGASGALADADREVGGSSLVGPDARPDGRDDASGSGHGGGRFMAKPTSFEFERIGRSSAGGQGQVVAEWSLQFPDATGEGWKQPRSTREAVSGPSEILRSSGCSRDSGAWPPEPGVGRMAHGVARRVDRLRALGNGQVPIVAAVAYLLLCEALEVDPEIGA